VIEIKAGGHFMAVMYFGSNEGMKTNAAAMASITESVQRSRNNLRPSPASRESMRRYFFVA